MENYNETKVANLIRDGSVTYTHLNETIEIMNLTRIEIFQSLYQFTKEDKAPLEEEMRKYIYQS